MSTVKSQKILQFDFNFNLNQNPNQKSSILSRSFSGSQNIVMRFQNVTLTQETLNYELCLPK